jgi:Tfp pilus assembly protein PilO
LETKIKNLTQLRKQYFDLQNDVSTITNAIAIRPDAHLLFAQIQSIAQASNVTIQKLQNFEVEAIRNDKSATKNYYSYSFAIGGSGSFKDISKFMETLTNMERVINVDIFSINDVSDQTNKPLEFSIQGTTFFKDNL